MPVPLKCWMNSSRDLRGNGDELKVCYWPTCYLAVTQDFVLPVDALQSCHASGEKEKDKQHMLIHIHHILHMYKLHTLAHAPTLKQPHAQREGERDAHEHLTDEDWAIMAAVERCTVWKSQVLQPQRKAEVPGGSVSDHPGNRGAHLQPQHGGETPRPPTLGEKMGDGRPHRISPLSSASGAIFLMSQTSGNRRAPALTLRLKPRGNATCGGGWEIARQGK